MNTQPLTNRVSLPSQPQGVAQLKCIQEVSPKKEISGEFSVLENQIDELSKNITSLEEKLSGLINNQNVAETDGASTPEKTLCEMAETFRQKRYIVEKINEKVRRLINSIEL